ncbi:MAG: hypothetical protein Q8934_06735 [Bacillota bacterium]|nr:hypothetical protein [Bacillota bacterium]
MENFQNSVNQQINENVPSTNAGPVKDKKKKIVKMVLGWVFLGFVVFLLPVLFGAISLCKNMMNYYELSHSFGVMFMCIVSMILVLVLFFSLISIGILLIRSGKA